MPRDLRIAEETLAIENDKIEEQARRQRLTHISAFLRFRRFSFFSSKALSYSSSPTSVAGVLGTVLGVHRPVNLGRSLSTPLHRLLVAGVIAGDCVPPDECSGDTVCSLTGDGGPEVIGERNEWMLRARVGDLRSPDAPARGSLPSSREYL